MPSLQQSVGGKFEPIMIPAAEVEQQVTIFIPHKWHSNKIKKVQYLDLDLDDCEEKVDTLKSKKGGESEPRTVYKTVDFIKTDAFNRTRMKVEEYKYNIKPEGKKPGSE